MVERLTVVFFIVLCLLLGCYLILAPWDATWGQGFIKTDAWIETLYRELTEK